MYITELQLNQFRNYLQLELPFSSGINCIFGPNGSGKTNILDAVHFISLTKGFRNNQDKQAVQKSAPYFMIQAKVDDTHQTKTYQCNLVLGKGKKYLINKAPLTKMSEHIGTLPLVAILPNDTELISGPSVIRRKFLDMLISQYDRQYLAHLIQYEKLLAQRNAQLKMFAEQRYFDADQLELWDTQLIPHGIRIVEGRKQFIKDFIPVFTDFFHQIVAKNEVPEITYRSQVKENTIPGWLDLLLQNRDKDLANHYSGTGTHRDDLIFSIDEQSARNFGSQGQQKTFIISLKLAQYQLLAERSGKKPFLLLDDIFDKLDEHRLGRIAQLLASQIPGQVFITDTTFERLQMAFGDQTDTEVQYIKVINGQASLHSPS
ncbi:MAG: DNA replication/repair protein RecF [Bacteroidota bacterium]